MLETIVGTGTNLNIDLVVQFVFVFAVIGLSLQFVAGIVGIIWIFRG